MSSLENEIIVLDIAGEKAILCCRKKSVESQLTALGFINDNARLMRAVVDTADREILVRSLIELDALFAAGPGWSPAELVALYRGQGVVTGTYKTISWKSPEQYLIVDH